MLLHKAGQEPYRCDLAISDDENKLIDLRDRIIEFMSSTDEEFEYDDWNY